VPVAAHRPAWGRGVGGRARPFAAFIDTHAADPAYEPASQVEYDELSADVRLSCTYGMLLWLSRDQRSAYLLCDLLGFADTEGAQICEICGISRAAFRQRLARARAIMRRLMGERYGLVRADNPCRCDRLVHAKHRPRDPRPRRSPLGPPPRRHAPHRDDHDRPARELDLAVALAEVYRTDPTFATPEALWDRLARSIPTLLGDR
jgi:hypothetical protein